MPKWGGAPSDKCTGCGKTVYPAEKLVMQGQIWHSDCLRCAQEDCNKKLGGANWGGFMPPDNTPYCKIHFNRIVKEAGKGGVSSGKEWTPRESSGSSSYTGPKLGGAPTDKCEKCGKTVYPAEKLSMEGRLFHHGCLRCDDCQKKLDGSNWGGFTQDGGAFCNTHIKQKVRASGSSTGLTGSASTWQKKESSGADSGSKPKPRFGGAPADKCEKCGKTVYPAEKQSLEGKIFHTGCVRCQYEGCNKILGGANFGGFMPPEGTPYCKIHFDRIIVSSGKGGVSSAAEWVPKESSGEKKPSRFGGGEKEKCVKCGKTVYPAEKFSMEGHIFHGPCLRCLQCNKQLTGANWGGFLAGDPLKPYCKNHMDQMIRATGTACDITGSTATGRD